MRKVALLAVAAAALASATTASATPGAHGQLLQVRANTNQSTNWFGYDQGSLELGGKQFNAIAGDWTVPAASQHTAGQEEFSSDWIGIGGGCIDAGVHPGDRVAIILGNRLEYPEVAAGLAKAALPSVPINPRLVASEMEYILRHSGAKAVILDDGGSQAEPMTFRLSILGQCNWVFVTGADERDFPGAQINDPDDHRHAQYFGAAAQELAVHLGNCRTEIVILAVQDERRQCLRHRHEQGRRNAFASDIPNQESDAVTVQSR